MTQPAHWIDALSAPAMVTWQLTRDCNLACLHCCTDSAPGRALKDELSREEALRLADQIIEAGVPKVMLCGGEPLIVPHFPELARRLGRAGVLLKIETNGRRFDATLASQLRELPIVSIQISLDGDTQRVYARQRPGADLRAAHAACRAAVAAGLPLEVTFAPTCLNVHEAEAVIDRAAALGAFRLNTGRLMRLGTAAKLWEKLELEPQEYAQYLELLREKRSALQGRMELCFEPWSLAEELKTQALIPPATLLVLPDGKVKVSAALPYVCADARREGLAGAWEGYRAAWKNPRVIRAAADIASNPDLLSRSNDWRTLEVAPDMASAEPAAPLTVCGAGRPELKEQP